jgi:hypothetical protein
MSGRIGLALIGALACAAPKPRAERVKPMSQKLDQARLVAELAPTWASADEKEGRQLLTELIADWAREADKDEDPASINKFQRQELEQRGAGKDARGKLVALRGLTVEHLVRQLGARTYKLGCAVVDGTVPREEAVKQGKALMAEVEALAPRARSVGDPEVEARLQRDLGDASLEALYAVEQKAASLRLGRYAADRKAH